MCCTRCICNTSSSTVCAETGLEVRGPASSHQHLAPTWWCISSAKMHPRQAGSRQVNDLLSVTHTGTNQRPPTATETSLSGCYSTMFTWCKQACASLIITTVKKKMVFTHQENCRNPWKKTHERWSKQPKPAAPLSPPVFSLMWALYYPVSSRNLLF